MTYPQINVKTALACFFRDKGHNLVPLPPDIITGIIDQPSFIVCFAFTAL